MPVDVQCPCGKTLKVREELAGRRVKCPVCAEILTVPDGNDDGYFDETADDDDRPEPQAPQRSKSTSGRMSISGKPANANLGTVVPASFGKTTLTLEDDRLIEDTRRPLATRHSEMRLIQVESVEIRSSPNPTLLVLGLLTIPIIIGIAVLIAWFFVRVRFLAVHSGSDVMVVCIKGPDTQFHDFMDAVLTRAEELDTRS